MEASEVEQKLIELAGQDVPELKEEVLSKAAYLN